MTQLPPRQSTTQPTVDLTSPTTSSSKYNMKVLVTGGAGYIGSHTVIELYAAGHSVVIVDNFINSCQEALTRLEAIVGKSIPFYHVDIVDKDALSAVFEEHTDINSVIHFAGLKAVGESARIPLTYYHNNITGTLVLLEVMAKFGVHNMVFSSSATVYGDPERLPLTEDCRIGGCTNPYGKTKYFIEEILRDYCAANADFNCVLLRYFNPIGAHPSGTIGEDPQGIPNNLLPYISQVAVGKRDHLSVFGADYETVDGTGVRDYIHVTDLATGHVAALKKVVENCGCICYNLGTGRGTSVLEMVHAFEKACGHSLKYEVVARRPGDVGSCFADATKAFNELGWKAVRTVEQACEDSWRWQSNNPNGFKDAE